MKCLLCGETWPLLYTILVQDLEGREVTRAWCKSCIDAALGPKVLAETIKTLDAFNAAVKRQFG